MLNGRCQFIELLTQNTVHPILINIPDEYNFMLQTSSHVYNLTKVPYKETQGDDVEDYVFISESKVQESYHDMSSHNYLPERHKLPMSEHLNNTYKHHIVLDEMDSKESIIVKELFRQLKRLRYSVHGIQHKIALFDNPFMGILDKHDGIHIYKIENIPRAKAAKKMVIVVNFRIFYDKVAIIEEETSQIVTSIYSILNNNQKTHTRNIDTIMKNRENIILQSNKLLDKKQEYINLLDQHSQLLSELEAYEKNTQHELQQLQIGNADNMHSDMKKTYKKNRLEKKLKGMKKTKTKIIDTMQEIRSKNEHLTLTLDTILFDNIVMLDKIFKNFRTLEKLQKNEI